MAPAPRAAMRKMGLPIAILLLPCLAHAEPLRATLVDGTTLEPIPHATARIGGRLVTADERGELVLAGIERAVEVEASAPGYASATQTVEPGGEPALVLLFRPEALEVVEIRAQAPRAVTAGGYTVTRDEIRNLPGGSRDALAAVRSLPGVATPPPLAAGRLVIRGGSPQDSLLTIDGVPVPFVYHAFDQTTILPVSMVGAIAYSPGGFGVEEGRATSGTVSILTSDEVPSRPTATGWLSLLDLAAVAAAPLSAERSVYVSGGIRRSTVDLLMPLAEDDDARIDFTTPPRYHDAQLRLDWVPGPRDRVYVLGLTSYDRAGVVNRMPGGGLPSDFEIDARFGRIIAGWRHETPAVRNRLVAALGATELHTRLDAVQHVDDVSTLAVLRDDLSVDASPRVRVRAGAFGQIERHDLDARSILLPTEPVGPGGLDELPIRTIDTTFDRGYAAGYAAADLRPTGSTTITAGARLDYFARIDAAVLEPRIEVAQRAGSMTLRAAAGRYARDPAQTQALATELSPELATQLAGVAELALGEGISASATVYRTARAQLAVEEPDRMTAAGELPYASSGTGSSTGVDLLLRLEREQLFGWLAYSWGRTVRRDRPGEVPHATAFDQTHALTALASYRVGAWQLGGRFQYASGLPYTDVVGARYEDELARYLPVLGAPYGTRYPGAAQLDLRVERRWQTRHVNLAAYLDVINVLRTPRVNRYSYSDDFSEREPVTAFVPLPSIGVRGEL